MGGPTPGSLFEFSTGWNLVEDVSDAQADAWWRDVVSWYGGEARVRFSTPLARRKWQTQQSTASYGVDAALASGESYRSMIVWRFDVAAISPIASTTPVVVSKDVAPTDYLLTDESETGLINGDVGWTIPWRFAACFGALQRPPTFDLSDGAPTGRGCWTPGAESSNGGECTKRLDGVMRANGAAGTRRSWPCHVRSPRVRRKEGAPLSRASSASRGERGGRAARLAREGGTLASRRLGGRATPAAGLGQHRGDHRAARDRDPHLHVDGDARLRAPGRRPAGRLAVVVPEARHRPAVHGVEGGGALQVPRGGGRRRAGAPPLQHGGPQGGHLPAPQSAVRRRVPRGHRVLLSVEVEPRPEAVNT